VKIVYGLDSWPKFQKNFFGTDTWFGNNVTVAEGSFAVDRKITVGNPGYIDGVTDVPNTGPNTIGYAPATDMPLSWTTNTQFSTDGNDARIINGVHTFHSTRVGEKTGRTIAKNIWKIGQNLFSNDRKCKKIGDDN